MYICIYDIVSVRTEQHYYQCNIYAFFRQLTENVFEMDRELMCQYTCNLCVSMLACICVDESTFVCM